MNLHLAIATSRKDSGYANPARARAAGIRFARTSLPSSLLKFPPCQYFDELNLYSFGKQRGDLYLRPHSKHPIVGRFVDEHHAVRIPHRNACDFEFASAD